MRVSRLMLVTLRDDPAEAEIPSHKLLLRAGYIRRIGSGIYAYLPLLWRVLQKISAIVREELNATGAQETLLPQLQPAELWQRSGRWAGYTAGEGIMFHLEDRQGRELGLGPTHEEVITALAADLLRSYRQLPVNLYQIQTKFRDEIRPRFGLMRGREFIMKDAYSFHADEACLKQTYAAMDQAYRRIFSRCGLRAVAVEADSGAIGGSASQEFMVTAEAGEDLILAAADGSYAANQERAVSLPAEAVALPGGVRADGAGELLATPGQTAIEELCGAHGFDLTQTVKVLLLLARFEDGTQQPLLVSLRGDQQLNDVKLANAVTARCSAEHGPLLELAPLSAEAAAKEGLAAIPFGFMGPHLDDAVLAGARSWRPRFLRLADATQHKAADRGEWRRIRTQRLDESGGEQQRPVDRAAHRGDAADLVDRRTDDGEVEPVGAADIAIEDVTDMQAEIHVGDRQHAGRAPPVQRCDVPGCGLRRVESPAAGTAAVVEVEDGQHAVAHQLEHVAALLVDGADDRLGIVVEHRNDLVGCCAVGDLGVATQIAEPEHGLDLGKMLRKLNRQRIGDPRRFGSRPP